jgi:hypothetical protein
VWKYRKTVMWVVAIVLPPLGTKPRLESTSVEVAYLIIMLIAAYVTISLLRASKSR